MLLIQGKELRAAEQRLACRNEALQRSLITRRSVHCDIHGVRALGKFIRSHSMNISEAVS